MTIQEWGSRAGVGFCPCCQDTEGHALFDGICYECRQSHFEGYAAARATLSQSSDVSDLLATLDSIDGRGDLNEHSPLEQLRQSALDQQEKDWRVYVQSLR